MKPFLRNWIKTLSGWVVGIPLLALMAGVSAVVQSTILCMFYAVFYTILDRIIDDLIRSRAERSKI